MHSQSLTSTISNQRTLDRVKRPVSRTEKVFIILADLARAGHPHTDGDGEFLILADQRMENTVAATHDAMTGLLNRESAKKLIDDRLNDRRPPPY